MILKILFRQESRRLPNDEMWILFETAFGIWKVASPRYADGPCGSKHLGVKEGVLFDSGSGAIRSQSLYHVPVGHHPIPIPIAAAARGGGLGLLVLWLRCKGYESFGKARPFDDSLRYRVRAVALGRAVPVVHTLRRARIRQQEGAPHIRDGHARASFEAKAVELLQLLSTESR